VFSSFWFIFTSITHVTHQEQPGHLAARLLTGDPDIKPRHFGDVISTGKLLSPDIYFQIEMEKLT
jgi:hypothetical protein